MIAWYGDSRKQVPVLCTMGDYQVASFICSSVFGILVHELK